MRAIVVRQGESVPSLIELPKPEPKPGEVLVRTLQVGVDGTDREVVRGAHGGLPNDDPYMILGHEAVGIVENANGTQLSEGDVVVPIVRRPGGHESEYYDRDELDMAPPGVYVEEGIVGGHGYMTEYFTSSPEFLVEVPRSLASVGTFVEPISVSEKAIEHAEATRAPFTWEPETALVLGNGSLGLVTLAMLDEYDRTYCLGRRSRPDITIEIIEELGATYINSNETSVADIPDVYEPADFIYEATGYAKHAYESVHALAPNGVVALLGVPEPGWRFEIDGSGFHNDIVLNSKAVIGSVTSHRKHFEQAIDTLEDLPQWCLDKLVTAYEPSQYEQAFTKTESEIKPVIQFSNL